MIDRNLKPGFDPDTFDWFNDYHDTRAWAVQNEPDLVVELDSGYNTWLAKRRAMICSM